MKTELNQHCNTELKLNWINENWTQSALQHRTKTELYQHYNTELKLNRINITTQN